MTLNIAHRGGAGLWPENTLAAFERAAQMGADGAELDVQLSRDGEIVVFHDYRLKPDICRDASGAWIKKAEPRIRDLSFDEMLRFDVGRARPGSDYAAKHPRSRPSTDREFRALRMWSISRARARKPFRLFVEIKTSFAERGLSASPEAVAEAAIAVLVEADYLDPRFSSASTGRRSCMRRRSNRRLPAGSRRWRKAGSRMACRRRKTSRRRRRRCRCFAIGLRQARRPGQAATMR